MEQVFSKDGKRLILEIDKLRNRAVYHVAEGSSQAEVLGKIVLDGFVTMPKGFSRDGFGLSKPAGTFLVQALENAMGAPLKLSILKSGASNIKPSGKLAHVC